MTRSVELSDYDSMVLMTNEQSLKPLLHALLVSGNVPTLSLANNKRIKSKGWKLIAIFVRKVSRLSCILEQSS